MGLSVGDSVGLSVGDSVGLCEFRVGGISAIESVCVWEVGRGGSSTRLKEIAEDTGLALSKLQQWKEVPLEEGCSSAAHIPPSDSPSASPWGCPSVTRWGSVRE